MPRDTGWQAAAPGVEVRHIRLGAQGTTTVILARLDPTQVRFRVLYTPGAPKRVAQWAAQNQALLVINASFFTREDRATALVVSDGERREQSYRGFGGMFAVAGEQIWIQSLREEPFNPEQALDQAVQTFPILIRPGGILNDQVDDLALAPRTAIALDRAGRVVAVVAPRAVFTLRGLAAFLADSDLDLDAALNLDGGTSTGMWLAAGETRINLDSLAPVPSVIAVEARQ
jgi:uncharacterized protein YigE (DUF2233 family)